jgi:CrcB protein
MVNRQATMVERLLLLGAAGALGTLARVGLSSVVQRAAGATFPYGSAVVNVTGCLLFGTVWALAETRVRAAPDVRLIVLSGFMGAFTTFSTYVFELGTLLADHRVTAALVHVVVQNALGLGALLFGLALGRAL